MRLRGAVCPWRPGWGAHGCGEAGDGWRATLPALFAFGDSCCEQTWPVAMPTVVAYVCFFISTNITAWR
jgi:hypothetical protein